MGLTTQSTVFDAPTNEQSQAGYGSNTSATADGMPAPTPQQAPRQAPEFTYDLNGVNPTADLSYNAMLRGYGLSKDQAYAQANYQRGSLNAQLQAQAPVFDQQLKEGLTNAGEAAADRGSARGSSLLHAQDLVQQDVSNREAAFKAGIADKQAQATFGLQGQLADLEQQRAQAEMDARVRLLQQQNKQSAYSQALQDLGMG